MMPKWVISSVGRASRLHRECRRFEPVITHHSSFILIQSITLAQREWLAVSQLHLKLSGVRHVLQAI